MMLMVRNLRLTLKPEDVRLVCVDHNYYTCGNNEEYGNMFSILNGTLKHSGSNVTAMRIESIAEDIKAHSDTEDTVEDIVWALCSKIKVAPNIMEY